MKFCVTVEEKVLFLETKETLIEEDTEVCSCKKSLRADFIWETVR